MSLFGKSEPEPTITVAAHLAIVERMDARYDALLDKFTALRVAGAVPEPKALVDVPRGTIQPPDELVELIDLQCGGDLRKRKMMLRQLAADRASHRPDADIAKDIRTGIEASGVPA